MDLKRLEKTKERVYGYLHRLGMHVDNVDFPQILRKMEEEMESGLCGEASSLAMIPTYIEAEKEVPQDTPVIVLDAGGTNFRTALLSFDPEGGARIEGYHKYPMPGSTGHVGREEFFDSIAEKTAELCDASARIGFCFSYPTEISPDKDGKLLHFSKEIKAPDVEGEYVGQQLKAALERVGISQKTHVVVLNDTVATLLAAKTAGIRDHFSTYLGFILGTGLNCAYIEENRCIEKIKGLSPEKSQIINMESGGFNGFTGGEVDEQFDGGTKSPGFYRFEKMVSGAYLGPLGHMLLARAAQEGLFTREAAESLEQLAQLNTIEMDGFLHSPAAGEAKVAQAVVTEEDKLTAYLLLENIVERAGKLAAINISAAVLRSGAGRDPSKPAAVCADGTTFYKTHRLKFFTEYYLKRELEEKMGRYIHIVGLDNAPLIGAAVAGLTN